MRRTATHLSASLLAACARPDPAMSPVSDSDSAASGGSMWAPGNRPDPGATSCVGPVR